MTGKLKKHRMIYFIANKAINKMMMRFDLSRIGKWFVSPMNCIITTTTKVDEAYILNMIEKSKDDNDDFWIPAIIWKGELYHHESVKELSDGKNWHILGDSYYE